MRHIAVVGLGSGGSAVADMLARARVGGFTLIDPDKLTERNLSRHVLDRRSVGKSKATEMAEHVLRVTVRSLAKPGITPENFRKLQVFAIPEKFDDTLPELPAKPDVIACCADSDLCCRLSMLILCVKKFLLFMAPFAVLPKLRR